MTMRRATNFNPRHPYGWRPQQQAAAAIGNIFQSTPPIRVATWTLLTWTGVNLNFNPRHPYGWRQCPTRIIRTLHRFQSTPPIRVATGRGIGRRLPAIISIHATHTGGDLGKSHIDQYLIEFQSTPPIRVATSLSVSISPRTAISIHATHTGGDGL